MSGASGGGLGRRGRLVVVRARVHNFSGAVDAWVLREAWADFLGQLVRLERDRAGEAVLESMSPGELRLRLFALDRAGHMGVEGELLVYYTAGHRPQVGSLTFDAVEFDPTALPTLVRELTAAAPV